MISTFIRRHKTALQWIGIALLIKLVLFAFFAVSFHKYWPTEMQLGLFNESGDTSVYYGSVESFYNGYGYDTYCRMPGLLPVYYVIRLFFSVYWTKNIIIVLQLLTGVVSVYVLAKLARLTFHSQRVFLITFFLYACSSFVSIWDHVGYADSFGTSFLIFSIYCLVRYKATREWRVLLISGCWMTWSLFFRPVHGIMIPVAFLIYGFDIRQFGDSIKKGLIYIFPVVLFLSLWTYRNYSKYQKVIVLQGNISECFKGLTKDLLIIRDLIVAWGGDSQPWSKNSEGEWFFGNAKQKSREPSRDNIYTSQYNLDSLVRLQSAYAIAHNDSLPNEIRDKNRAIIIASCTRYLQSYKQEHAFRYYVLNKLKLLRKFTIPGRLDDLPLPSLDQMNLLQKAVKAGYFLLLILVNVLGLIGSLLALWRRIYLPLIPLILLITLCPIMGFMEQRYLVPVYPFFVILSAYTLNRCLCLLRPEKTEAAH